MRFDDKPGPKITGEALCRWCSKPEAEHEYTGKFKGLYCYLLGDCTIYKYQDSMTEAPPERSPVCLESSSPGCFPRCTWRCAALIQQRSGELPTKTDVKPEPTSYQDWVTGEPSPDLVNHPQHYGGQDNPYEAIKVIEAWGLGFNLGNVVKYLCREASKDGLQDLRKALWYIEREIAKREVASREADATRGSHVEPPGSGGST